MNHINYKPVKENKILNQEEKIQGVIVLLAVKKECLTRLSSSNQFSKSMLMKFSKFFGLVERNRVALISLKRNNCRHEALNDDEMISPVMNDHRNVSP